MLLSHDVGLGKTLQVIALIWTMLRQSPRPSYDVHRDIRCSITKSGAPAVPAALVGNWKEQFKKWLDLKIEIEAIDGSNTSDAAKKQLLKEWALENQKRRLVLVCSYETFAARRRLLENKAQLLVSCRSAHRLKAKDGSKTLDGLKKLNCKMRVLLSGTAVQNNLAEFYSLMDFANPGVLSDYMTFRKVYQLPARANDTKATEEEKMIGKARAKAIFEKTAIFIDRCAKSDVLIDGLPPKTEYCLFLSLTVAPTEKLQAGVRSSDHETCGQSSGSVRCFAESMQRHRYVIVVVFVFIERTATRHPGSE